MKKVLFPIGKYKKEKVRAIAKKAGLHNDQKKDSQGICFIGEINMRDFLIKFIGKKVGNIYLGEKIIGEHDGAHLYTIGQRIGSSVKEKEYIGKKYYVVNKDIDKNDNFCR